MLNTSKSEVVYLEFKILFLTLRRSINLKVFLMKIKKISLRNLNDEALSANELTHVVGGANCGCGCNGSSSTSANMSANYGSGLTSPGTCSYLGYDGENTEFTVQTHAYV